MKSCSGLLKPHNFINYPLNLLLTL
jgi:hypothetical protein